MNEKLTRLEAIQSNIARYEGMLKSRLNSTEFQFVEKRLSEERFALAMAQFMGPSDSPKVINLPDALP